MAEWNRLHNQPDAELRASAASLRSTMPAELGPLFEGQPPLTGEVKAPPRQGFFAE
jgi:hypothetical protein